MSQCLLIEIVLNPQKMYSLSMRQWDLLIRQARTANLMGRLFFLLKELNGIESLPDEVKKHFISENMYFEAQRASILWEIENIKKALDSVNTPIVLLKGAAYLRAGLNVSKGRFFNDIDILVTHESINNAESMLKQHGWLSTHLDEYDQKYYRKWMHEIPPLRQVRRKTVLDVHHNILPITTRNAPDSQKLLDASLPLDEDGKLRVLSNIDMFIHSATHLFNEGEFSYGLRDLVDLSLLSEESSEGNYWNDLVERAKELGLEWPVHYAIICLEKVLKIQIPADIRHSLNNSIPAGIRRKFVSLLYFIVFKSVHHTCSQAGVTFAMRLLYIRGHWIKMPLMLLLPHLVRKAARKDKRHEA